MSRRAALAAAALAAAGCQGPGVSVSELSPEPLAVLYRTPEESRRRAEDLEEAAAGGAQHRGRRFGVDEQGAVVGVDQVRDYLAGVIGRGEDAEQLYPGRLALLDPRSGRVQTIASARVGARPVAWSPDHRRLLFTQLEGEFLQLFEYDRDTQSVRPITHPPLVHPRGCYGPEGRMVLMRLGIEDGKPTARIALTAPGGVEPEPISPGPSDHSPACASDGSAVAWVATTGPGRDWIMAIAPPDGGSPQRLARGRQPSFTPDGWIVYSAQTGREEWRLYRIRPDGTGRAPLGDGTYDEEHPAVSPDGRHVAYVADPAYHRHLYLRRIDGSGDRIFFADGDADHPVW